MDTSPTNKTPSGLNISRTFVQEQKTRFDGSVYWRGQDGQFRFRNASRYKLEETDRQSLDLDDDFEISITATGYKPHVYATEVTTLNLSGDIKGSISATAFSHGDGIGNDRRIRGGYGGCPPYALSRSKVYGDDDNQILNIRAQSTSISDQHIISYAAKGSRIELGGGDDVLNIDSEVVTRRTSATHWSYPQYSHFGPGASIVGQGYQRSYQGISEGDAYALLSSSIDMGDGDDSVTLSAKVSATGPDWDPKFLANRGFDYDEDTQHGNSQAELLTYSTVDLGAGDDVLKLHSNTRIMGNRGIVKGGEGFDVVQIFNQNARVYHHSSDMSFSVGGIQFFDVEKLELNGVTMFDDYFDPTSPADTVSFDNETGMIVDGSKEFHIGDRYHNHTRNWFDARATERGYELIGNGTQNEFARARHTLISYDKDGEKTDFRYIMNELVDDTYEKKFNFDLDGDGLVAGMPESINPEVSSSVAVLPIGIGEYGSVSVNHQWQDIELSLDYINPVIISSDPTRRGGDPAVVRLRNIGSESFQIRLQEPNYKDGRHTKETISYVVMEEGTWELSDGTTLEAGVLNTNKLSTKGRETVALDDAFGSDTSVAVLTQTQTYNESDWVTTRTDNITGESFEVMMQKEEKLNRRGHVTESIGWLAIEQGSASDGDTIIEGGVTADKFTHRAKSHSFATEFDSAPTLLTKLDSFDGGDTANSRIRSVDAGGFTAMISEEQSRDRETGHTTESLSYLALSGDSGTLSGIPVI